MTPTARRLVVAKLARIGGPMPQPVKPGAPADTEPAPHN